MSGWSRLTAGVFLFGAVHAAVGCNAVLGIESASLEAGSCEAGLGLTLNECTTSQTCEHCVASACSPQQRESCLQNSACRQALANYRLCQRDDCTDPASGDCEGCLTATPAACFANCADECQTSEIVSLCAIFCACMQDNCAGKLDPTACQTNCVTDAPWRRNCRLSHCELALNSADEHCLHATDELKACEATAPMPDPNCEKKQIGYGCKSPDDCCSGFCPDGFCRLM